jgi:hypothetical protein
LKPKKKSVRRSASEARRSVGIQKSNDSFKKSYDSLKEQVLQGKLRETELLRGIEALQANERVLRELAENAAQQLLTQKFQTNFNSTITTEKSDGPYFYETSQTQVESRQLMDVNQSSECQELDTAQKKQITNQSLSTNSLINRKLDPKTEEKDIFSKKLQAQPVLLAGSINLTEEENLNIINADLPSSLSKSNQGHTKNECCSNISKSETKNTAKRGCSVN